MISSCTDNAIRLKGFFAVSNDFVVFSLAMISLMLSFFPLSILPLLSMPLCEHNLRKLCQQKGIEIVEAEACPVHIHMLVSIPPKYSVSQVMGYLKGKSSLMIFDRYANLKYKYGNRHFWARGYYVDTVGRNKKQVAEYIRNQLQADQMADQIGLKEFVDPFTGRENKKA